MPGCMRAHAASAAQRGGNASERMASLAWMLAILLAPHARLPSAASAAPLLPPTTAAHQRGLLDTAAARPPDFVAVTNGPWGAAATWNRQRAPTNGSSVLVPAGVKVTWAPAPKGDLFLRLKGLEVNGRLECGAAASADTRVRLTVETVLVRGKGATLSCGTVAKPFPGRLDISLTGQTTEGDNVRSVIAIDGGTIALHGNVKKSWTRLAEGYPARAGDTAITVAGPINGWRIGNAIAISPTDFDYKEAEQRRITSMVGSTSDVRVVLGLDRPLAFTHNAVRKSVQHGGNGRKYTLDARAEVAMLSRNIRIAGDMNGMAPGQGGDVRAEDYGAALQFSNVELVRLGKFEQLGRYPFHLHNLGASGARSYANGVAIHSSFQRCMVVHCTDNTQLRSNVCFDIPGFAFMLEDGGEVNNTLAGNLGILSRPHSGKFVITERTLPGTYWFLNPNNHFVNNVAAGSHGPGYMLDLGIEFHVRWPKLGTCTSRIPGVIPSNPLASGPVVAALLATPLGRFEGNSAHSVNSGLWLVGEGQHTDARSMPVNTIRNCQFYKVRVTGAVEFEACYHLAMVMNYRIYDSICANSRLGYWHNQGNTLVEDNVFMRAPLLLGNASNPEKDTAFIGFNLYRAAQFGNRIHYSGFPAQPITKEIFIKPNQGGFIFASLINAAATVGPGDVSAPKGVLGKLTWDVPLRVELYPGFPHALLDAAGSVSGIPGALLVPIARCIQGDSIAPMISMWRSDEANCPRVVDPVVADILASDPEIACTYRPGQVLFACTGGLRLQGLGLTLLAPGRPATAEGLAVDLYSADGRYLRQVVQLFELATSSLVALAPNTLYRLRSPALSEAQQAFLSYGPTEFVTDFMRLVLEEVPEATVSTGSALRDAQLAGQLVQVDSVDAVEACAPPALICHHYDPLARALHLKMRPNNAIAAPIRLDGRLAGLKEPLTTLVIAFRRQ